MLLCKQRESTLQLYGKDSEVPNADSGTDAEPLEQYNTILTIMCLPMTYNILTNLNPLVNTLPVVGDSNVTPDSPDMCDNDIQDDQNDVECDDERVALANLIANLKLDVDENKKIQKQLKKANATLTQELTECKSILAETSRTLRESNSIRDSCLVALQNKQTEFERYKAFNDRTVKYDKLKRRLNETLGLLAQKETDIKESLKVKAYEISVVKEKHDELVKQSLLTKSHYEGLVKEKTKVITDLKLKEEKDIDKMISMENQLKFLNEIVYKRSQSIQTIHMLAPKSPPFNDRPTFANQLPKKGSKEKPVLIPKPSVLGKPAPFLDSLERTNFAKKKSVSKTNELEGLSKPVTTTNLPQDTPKDPSTYQATQLMLYEKTSKEWKWWIVEQCPSGYKWVLKTKIKWVPKVRKEDANTNISPTIDNTSRITNVLKIINTLGSNLSCVPSSSNSLADCTVHFGNDQFAPILGYGDFVQGNIMINRVYYAEGLNHNLFLVGQFCDADLEVAFQKSTCFIRDLQGNDLLTSNHGSDLYTISL
ncbi:hypothetical protein Tco_0816872 [Tanacetum coccineum]